MELGPGVQEGDAMVESVERDEASGSRWCGCLRLSTARALFLFGMSTPIGPSAGALSLPPPDSKLVDPPIISDLA